MLRVPAVHMHTTGYVPGSSVLVYFLLYLSMVGFLGPFVVELTTIAPPGTGEGNFVHLYGYQHHGTMQVNDF